MTAPKTATTLTTRESRPRSRSRRRGTSLSGGKVQAGHQVHGAKESNDYERKNSRKGRSKSREPRKTKPKPRREYATPFDDKGRCHYHVNVLLASKKFNGGWKVLCQACPKCMEDKSNDSGDEKSVRSARSGKSSSGAAGGDAHGKYDKNGCCAVHSHIQVAKKGFLGSGWKVMRTCPSCSGGASVGLDGDAISVKSGKSGKSARSTTSRKSQSKPSTKSRSTAKSGKATSTGRYGALPFDGDGYCCRHPSVQIAQKKIIGGFKIMHDVCPDCKAEDGENEGQRKGRNRSKSRNRHRSSSRHHRTNDQDETGSVGSSSNKKKKRIRVKNLKTEDENGKHGRYSGYVNDDHQPHGNGVMKYEDGSQYDGVWSEGSKVHGKTTSERKPSKTKF